MQHREECAPNPTTTPTVTNERDFHYVNSRRNKSTFRPWQWHRHLQCQAVPVVAVGEGTSESKYMYSVAETKSSPKVSGVVSVGPVRRSRLPDPLLCRRGEDGNVGAIPNRNNININNKARPFTGGFGFQRRAKPSNIEFQKYYYYATTNVRQPQRVLPQLPRCATPLVGASHSLSMPTIMNDSRSPIRSVAISPNPSHHRENENMVVKDKRILVQQDPSPHARVAEGLHCADVATTCCSAHSPQKDRSGQSLVAELKAAMERKVRCATPLGGGFRKRNIRADSSYTQM